MNANAFQIRSARRDERDRIVAVHRDAFGGGEGPVITNLVDEMLDDPTSSPI